MNKILIDRESFTYIGDWFINNNILINRLPMLLAESTLVWDDMGKQALLDVVWLSDDSFRIKTSLPAFKLDFTVFLDYDSSNRVIAARRLAAVMGVSESEIQPVNESYCNFDIGLQNNMDENYRFTTYGERAARSLAYLYIYTTYFMMNYQAEVVEYVKDSRETVSKKKKNGKKKPKTVSVTTINVTKYVRDVQNGAKKLPRRNKKCEYAFSVRSHLRHYKSGKVVEIKSYQKNTLAQRIERDKIYKFNLKKDGGKNGKK